MADKIKSAMRGNGKRARILRCLGVFVAVVALFATTATWAAAEAQTNKIQNLTISWKAEANKGEGVVQNGSEVTLTPQSPKVDAAGTSVTATVSFAVSDADSTTKIQKDEFELRLPAHIFKDRSDRPVGEFQLPANILTSADEATANEDQLYYFYDETSDEIVIRNATAFTSNPNFSFEIVWKSTSAGTEDASASGARNIMNGYENNDIKVKYTLKKDGAEIESHESQPLSVSYSTSSNFKITKEARDYQYSWDDAWGTNPDSSDNGDKYIYTKWEVVVNQNGLGTQPYSMAVEDRPENGTVVWCSLDHDELTPSTTEWTVDASDTELAEEKTITYIVRYNRPADTTQRVNFKNVAKGTMTTVDGGSTELTAEKAYGISTLDFKYDGAGPGISKDCYETYREGAVNAIRDYSGGAESNLFKNFRYNNAGSMRGGVLTRAEGDTSTELSAYGKRSYSVELTDDLLVLGSEQLVDGDYEIEQVTVGDRTEVAYKEQGGRSVPTTLKPAEWCKEGKSADADGNPINPYSANDPSTDGLPTVSVMVRFAAGSEGAQKYGTGYVSYGTVTYGVDNEDSKTVSTSKSHFAAADEFMQQQYMTVYGNSHKDENGAVYEWYGSSNTRLPLELPRNVTGVQLVWKSKNYSTRIMSTALINLHATEHIQQIVADAPSADLVNINSLRAYDPDGKWFMPQANPSNIEGDLGALVVARDNQVANIDASQSARYMFHATAVDKLLSYSGHTSICKGGRSKSSDNEADNSLSASIAFNSYSNANGSGYQGLYYLDMADWTSLDEMEVGSWYGVDRAISTARQKNLLTEQKEGTFYDLLPAGMIVDPSSVTVWKKKLERVNEKAYSNPKKGLWDDEGEGVNGTPAVGKTAYSYTWREQNDVPTSNYSPSDYQNARCDSSVEFIQNWRDTGRTMMVVHASVKDDSNMGALAFMLPSQNYRHMFVYSGFHVEFKATYTAEAADDYGDNFINTVGYMGKSGSKLWDGLSDDPSTLADDELKDKALMQDLNGDGVYGDASDADKNVVYAQEDTQITNALMSSANSDKRVMDERDSEWKTETATTQGGSYRYRLRMKAPHKLKNAVFFDALERNVVTTSITPDNPVRWYGTLKGVDATQARRWGIEPVVYYTTSSDLSSLYTSSTAASNDGTLRDLEALDANGNLVWVKADNYAAEHGGDLSAVTGIAVDLGHDADGNDVTIEQNKSISVYIDMQAPDDAEACKDYHNRNARAVNRWIMSSDQELIAGSGNFTHQLTPIDPVKVSIEAEVADFGFTKVDRSGNALSGAEFKLFKWTGSGQAPAGSNMVDAANPGSNWALVDNDSVTSGDNGSVEFKNLAKGTYRLVETKAPGGYVLPGGQWQIKVNPNAGTGVGTGKQIQIESVGEKQPPAFKADQDSGALSLTNYKPFELPVSGGWGLVGIGAAALALIVAGAALSRFRRNHL